MMKERRTSSNNAFQLSESVESPSAEDQASCTSKEVYTDVEEEGEPSATEPLEALDEALDKEAKDAALDPQQRLVNTLERFSQNVKAVVVDYYNRLDHHLERVEHADGNMQALSAHIVNRTSSLKKRKFDTMNQFQSFL